MEIEGVMMVEGNDACKFCKMMNGALLIAGDEFYSKEHIALNCDDIHSERCKRKFFPFYTLTKEMVQRRVDVISEESKRGWGCNDAMCHIAEDKLFGDVLLALSLGRLEDVTGSAREALRSLELTFSRWYE